MSHSWEPRTQEIIRSWDQALELYQDYRDDVERSIREYDDLEREYESIRYSLLEAEDQIRELERDNQMLRRKLSSVTATYSNISLSE